MENTLCKAHSGFEAKIKSNEENVKALWKKWDSMVKWLIGILTATIVNLIILIILLGLKLNGS